MKDMESYQLKEYNNMTWHGIAWHVMTCLHESRSASLPTFAEYTHACWMNEEKLTGSTGRPENFMINLDHFRFQSSQPSQPLVHFNFVTSPEFWNQALLKSPDFFAKGFGCHFSWTFRSPGEPRSFSNILKFKFSCRLQPVKFNFGETLLQIP